MKTILVIACMAMVAGCAPKSHYEWAGYEESLYTYTKNPAAGDAYAQSLAVAVQKGDAVGKTPPGLHAEYGYMLLTQGKTAEALQEFDTEKRLWPESGPLIDRVRATASGSRVRQTTLTGAGT